MSSRKYPTKDAQVRRKEDGLTGQVYVSSPTTDLVAVRWQKEDETGTLLYDIDQFARDWELTRTKSTKWKVAAAAVAIVAVCGICALLWPESMGRLARRRGGGGGPATAWR